MNGRGGEMKSRVGTGKREETGFGGQGKDGGVRYLTNAEQEIECKQIQIFVDYIK